MDYRITIIQDENNVNSVYIELLNMATGEIVTSGKAMLDKQAIISCITYMIDEHL
jgi:hypothetical protein